MERFTPSIQQCPAPKTDEYWHRQALRVLARAVETDPTPSRWLARIQYHLDALSAAMRAGVV